VKTVIIQGSARGDGNTQKMIEQLFPGKQIDLVKLSDLSIAPYNYDNAYPEDDHFMELMEKMIPKYDLFLFATPVYWYSLSGLTKNFLDRISDLYDINRPLGQQLQGKKLAMLSISNGNDCPEGFAVPFKLSAKYLGMDYLGTAHFWLEDHKVPEKALKAGEKLLKTLSNME
jgi:multimeric flavodoxin WrbA